MGLNPISGPNVAVRAAGEIGIINCPRASQISALLHLLPSERWTELLQSLCADYFGPYPADDGINEGRNGQWQVSPVGVDDAHAEIATHVLGQHRYQSASFEIGRPQYRC